MDSEQDKKLSSNSVCIMYKLLRPTKCIDLASLPMKPGKKRQHVGSAKSTHAQSKESQSLRCATTSVMYQYPPTPCPLATYGAWSVDLLQTPVRASHKINSGKRCDCIWDVVGMPPSRHNPTHPIAHLLNY